MGAAEMRRASVGGIVRLAGGVGAVVSGEVLTFWFLHVRWY
jgi:hypothetical protein